MHIITGLLVTALLGRKKSQHGSDGLPALNTGPVQVAHAIPGRLRLVIPSLRQSDTADLPAIDTLRSLTGIQMVSVNTISGSLLIRYDSQLVDAGLVFGATVKLLGLESELEQIPSSAVLRQIQALGGNLNRAVFQESHGLVDLKTILILTLLFLGTKKLVQEKWASLPAGLTLIWWALNSLSKTND